MYPKVCTKPKQIWPILHTLDKARQTQNPQSIDQIAVKYRSIQDYRIWQNRGSTPIVCRHFYLYPNIPNGGRVVSHKKATKKKPPAWRLEIKSQGIDEYLGQITRDEIPGILSKMGVAFSPENPLCIKAKTIHDVLQSWCGAQQPKIFSVKRIRKPKSELFLLCEQIAKIVGGVLLVDLSPKIFEVLKFRIALKVEERRAQKMFVLLKQILCWQARNNYTFQKDFVPNKLWVRNPFRNPLSPYLLQELRRMYPETYLAMLLVSVTMNWRL